VSDHQCSTECADNPDCPVILRYDRDAALLQAERYREALEAAARELGVPTDGYPTPVANAWRIIMRALAARQALQEQRAVSETELDARRILARHQRDAAVYGFGHCRYCGEVWPCSSSPRQALQEQSV